ncbi:hypothetical protein LIER_40697 [Lithospermum erythrorhizon]|uniref:Uncharacterized protein n=1 Tax=Lithospermum erythrorhizon TaxID=34254 RepID=A0AAV3R0U2_LITER
MLERCLSDAKLTLISNKHNIKALKTMKKCHELQGDFAMPKYQYGEIEEESTIQSFKVKNGDEEEDRLSTGHERTKKKSSRRIKIGRDESWMQAED